MTLGMNFYNKHEREEQMKQMKQQHTRIMEFTALHRLSCSPLSVTDGTDYAEIPQKYPDLLAAFTDLSHGYLQSVSLGEKNDQLVVGVQLQPLSVLLPSRTSVHPSGKGAEKHALSTQTIEHILRAYAASSLLWSARYRGEVCEVDSLIIAQVQTDDPSQFHGAWTIDRTTWRASQQRTEKIADYFSSHLSPLTA